MKPRFVPEQEVSFYNSDNKFTVGMVESVYWWSSGIEYSVAIETPGGVMTVTFTDFEDKKADLEGRLQFNLNQ